MLKGSKLSRRNLIGVFGMAGATVILAACGNTATQQVVKETVIVTQQVEKVVKETVVVEKQVTAQPAAEGVIHLKYLEFPSRNLKGIAGLCSKYSEERNGKVVVDIVIEPDNVWNKLTMMHMAGDPADLTQWGLDIIDLAIRDIILKLDDYLQRDGIDIEAEFSPISVQACKFSTWGLNGYYGVPLYVNPKFIIYNKNIFNEIGVPEPPKKATEAWTCEEFTDYATKMTNADKGRWGTSDMDLWWTNDPPYFNGHSFNEGGTKVLWDERAAMAYQWISDLINKYKVAPTPEQAQMMGGGQIFMTGQVGMTMASGWSLVALRDITDFEWNVAMLPFSGDGAQYRAGNNEPNVWAIDSTTKYREQAWDFIKWMTINPERNAEQCKVYGSMSPSNKGLPILLKWYEEQYGIDTTSFVETLKYGELTGENYWDNPNWATCLSDTEINAKFDELKLGRLSGEEFIKVIAPQLEAIMAKEYSGRTANG